MAQAKAIRVSVEAELLRTGISGGISLSPGKKLRFVHEFRGADGTFYRSETSKALHTERVKLSGEICSIGTNSDGSKTYQLIKPVIKEVR